MRCLFARLIKTCARRRVSRALIVSLDGFEVVCAASDAEGDFSIALRGRSQG